MYIGIDIGATNTRIVAVDNIIDPVFLHRISLPTNHNFTSALKEIISAIYSCTSSAIQGIGIGLPGGVDEEGTLTGSTNLPTWEYKPLRQELMSEYNCQVLVKNDAEMGALGEAVYGEHGQHDFFYLTWGTGLGCAQIRWQKNKALVSRPKDRQSVYDFEQLIGGKDLERRFGKLAKDLAAAEWQVVYSDLITELPKVMHEYGHDRVVFGGGIAARRKADLLSFTASLKEEVLVTNLGDDIGLYGAIASLR